MSGIMLTNDIFRLLPQCVHRHQGRVVRERFLDSLDFEVRKGWIWTGRERRPLQVRWQEAQQ